MRRTSPRAGAGVILHSANPRFALATARSRSDAPDSGKVPMRSFRSAGFRFSKYSPESGGTQAPAMKLLNCFIGDTLCVFARERIALDFLVEIRPGHLYRSGGLGNIPVELTQLAEQVRPLGGRQYLVVANYDGKQFLLGVTPGCINLLTSLDESDATATAPRASNITEEKP